MYIYVRVQGIIAESVKILTPISA